MCASVLESLTSVKVGLHSITRTPHQSSCINEFGLVWFGLVWFGSVRCLIATGFKPYCPPQLQNAIISKLDGWLRDDSILHVLWSKNANVQIMLEIYRQCCRLSITYDDTIKQGIHVFKELFWVCVVFLAWLLGSLFDRP
jgi:hypothetical protein